MLSNKSPLRVLSRRTAQSVDNSPEVKAFLNGHTVTPNTWGGYATRAVDLGICEPEVDEVVRTFGGSSLVDLRDPTIRFHSMRKFHDYKAQFTELRSAEHAEDLKVERDRLLSTARLVISQWEIDREGGHERANVIQQLIASGNTESDIDVLCLQRDGLHDGIEVSLGEFSETMLRVNVLDEDAPSELACFWVSGIGRVVEALRTDYGYMDDFDHRPVAELPLSMSQIGEFLGEINISHFKAAQQRSLEDWDTIAPVFATPSSLPVLEGTER